MLSDPFGLVGTTVGGHYAVQSVAGEGGFSIVYRARHTLWDRPVAIKAFRGLEGVEPETRERMLRAFVQEGAMLVDLSERTTAIVQARDMATLVTPSGEWVPYLVLEWLQGESLESVLWQERRTKAVPRTLAQAVALLEPIARALALAHAKGICHRDLKPGNVFVLGDARAEDSTTKLLDFGVAAFFSDARRSLLPNEQRHAVPYAYTPSYAAPEQFSQAYGVTGPWTDVFALALMLVELVTGRDPLGEGTADQLARVATDKKRRPTLRAHGADVSDAVEKVVERALAIYPAERWQVAGTFWDELTAAIAEDRSAAPPAHSGRRLQPARPLPRAGIGMALVLALSATAASDATARVAPHANANAEASASLQGSALAGGQSLR